ncbi:pilus assembly protein TadE [Allokutzneria sp. A3M-2-11 16]|uniref:TadE/TadG family type IV pilus assembly protein n=1 Tax=Allokutzneria sp. A3M-2-11 16 TaxID=2962043 RepID=UPI0020B67C6F|nr:TadE/TadG family type IV pilus assembly protein [Allokutzneria sp. A3M-2-11 16]MCP3800704.1 pilus assembly protein TadE [Allokutzneria sp. A3M-2-11 16]
MPAPTSVTAPRCRGRGRNRWAAWWRADSGSAAAEITVITPLLITLLVFVSVLIHRGVAARVRLEGAAHQAARAASIERHTAAATTAARSTSANALSSAGLACTSLTVDIATGGMRPGGTVTVTITCTVDLGDALLLGVPGTKRLSATASEPIDTWRSTPIAAGGRP